MPRDMLKNVHEASRKENSRLISIPIFFFNLTLFISFRNKYVRVYCQRKNTVFGIHPSKFAPIDGPNPIEDKKIYKFSGFSLKIYKKAFNYCGILECSN